MKQHIEMIQDIAGYFSTTFGHQVRKQLEAKLNEALLAPEIDGQVTPKGYDSAVNLFELPADIRHSLRMYIP